MNKPTVASLALAHIWFAVSAFQPARADEGLNFFESRIGPLLQAHCIGCHGGLDPKGGLSLESRTGWQEAGVIVPGAPEEGLPIIRMGYSDPLDAREELKERLRRLPVAPFGAFGADVTAIVEEEDL